MGTHPSKVKGKMRAQVDTTQRKNKSKNPYANRTHGYEMMSK
jgi:hypothetical protein